jgi:hypothetical protein
MCDPLDLQFVRDCVKEALEADDLDQVRSELEECLKILEKEL